MKIFKKTDLDAFFRQQTQGPEEFLGISTDSRKSQEQALFFALKGETHDAHQFLTQALSSGAKGFVVEKWDLPSSPGISVYKVPDVLKALQDLAHRERQKFTGPVVGITGSNGKTTTKEFLAAILAPYRRVHFSKGSFNNHFGVPFTLLSQPQDAEVTICEMGMNHAHEIENLCKINEPTHVVCTMVGQAHIELLGSVEGIAKAKEEIYQNARESAVRVYNLDNPWTKQMVHRAHPRSNRVIRFSSEDSGAEVHLQVTHMDLESLEVKGHIGGIEGKKKIPVFGLQNLTNLHAASSLALGLGLSPFEIWESLPECKTIWGRNQRVRTRKGFEILFDGYNSNPESMKALMQNQSRLSQRCAGIFAEMLELGPHAAQYHFEVGEIVGASNLRAVYFYGPHSADFARGIKAAGFSKSLFISDSYKESLALEVFSVLGEKDLLLVKGSRGMKLETVVGLAQPLDF